MKKSNINFRVLILTIVFLFNVFINTSEVLAAYWSDIIQKGDNFIEQGKGEFFINVDNELIIMNEVSDQKVRDVINELYNILFPLGVVITVIVGGILGIKFMLASAEDKAEVKKSMVPYVVGCIVIYSAFGIWKMCIQIFSALT